jgi:hypothetical protein
MRLLVQNVPSRLALRQSRQVAPSLSYLQIVWNHKDDRAERDECEMGQDKEWDAQYGSGWVKEMAVQVGVEWTYRRQFADIWSCTAGEDGAKPGSNGGDC